MTPVIIVILVLSTFIGMGLAAYFYTQYQKEALLKREALQKSENLSEEEKIKLLDDISKKKIQEAENKSREIVQQAHKEILEKKKELVDVEKAIVERESILSKKSDTLLEKEKKLDQREEEVDKEKEVLKTEREGVADRLAQVAGLTKLEAKEKLLTETKISLERDFAVMIKENRERAEKESEELAKEIIIDAMTAAGTDYVSEMTTTNFPVAGEEIKGKIIGKEGRNIKAFEKLTGVELIMDEADNYVVLSCYDPLRRELARIALEKLVKDGRIHPARIEEFVQRARAELSKQILKDGEEIAFKAGFPHYSLEHLKYLGRMKYRYSYGQCLATHVLEVVNFAGKAAAELGLDITLAKECALWHDIGKVESQEKEGDHMELGEEIGKKIGLREEVLNAMYAHHLAKDPVCMESALIYIADANSAGRPGARYGSHEDYVKRIKALEVIAKQHDEVREAYAVDAGREVRVFVDPIMAGDDTITILSNDIAKEIQQKQSYPGTVKITVIREIRSTAIAK
jgi:ribonuclease Y